MYRQKSRTNKIFYNTRPHFRLELNFQKKKINPLDTTAFKLIFNRTDEDFVLSLFKFFFLNLKNIIILYPLLFSFPSPSIYKYNNGAQLELQKRASCAEFLNSIFPEKTKLHIEKFYFTFPFRV